MVCGFTGLFLLLEMYADGELKDVDVRLVLKLFSPDDEEMLDRAVAKLRPLI